MTGVWELARRKAGTTWGRFTQSLRPLPDYIIIGAHKAGTTSLYYHLLRHPKVKPARFKELRFFDRHYHRGQRWYRGHFPRSGMADPNRGTCGFVSGEASPNYLADPRVPQRVSHVVPNAKLVVLLRNPVSRAYSHYYHNVRKGREQDSLEEAIRKDIERVAGLSPTEIANSPSYLCSGMYAVHLNRWLSVFPREQLLVVRSEDYFEKSDTVPRTILPFLGLPAHPMGDAPRCNAGSYPAAPDALSVALAKFYEPHNRRLRELCGEAFRWHE